MPIYQAIPKGTRVQINTGILYMAGRFGTVIGGSHNPNCVNVLIDGKSKLDKHCIHIKFLDVLPQEQIPEYSSC